MTLTFRFGLNNSQATARQPSMVEGKILVLGLNRQRQTERERDDGLLVCCCTQT